MSTMDEKYGDGSVHKVCDFCGLCVDCKDCECDNIQNKGRNHDTA